MVEGLEPDSPYFFRLRAKHNPLGGDAEDVNQSKLGSKDALDDHKHSEIKLAFDGMSHGSESKRSKPHVLRGRKADVDDSANDHADNDDDSPDAHAPAKYDNEGQKDGWASHHADVCGPVVSVDTQVEVLFMLDPSAVGPNLQLSNGNFTVTNKQHKKWNAVRATVGFTSGVHTWDVHINKCVSKNIFIGVMEQHACMDNYVGSDRHGWGYLANKVRPIDAKMI